MEADLAGEAKPVDGEDGGKEARRPGRGGSKGPPEEVGKKRVRKPTEKFREEPVILPALSTSTLPCYAMPVILHALSTSTLLCHSLPYRLRIARPAVFYLFRVPLRL